MYITKAIISRHGQTKDCPACEGITTVHLPRCRERFETVMKDAQTQEAAEEAAKPEEKPEEVEEPKPRVEESMEVDASKELQSSSAAAADGQEKRPAQEDWSELAQRLKARKEAVDRATSSSSTGPRREPPAAEEPPLQRARTLRPTLSAPPLYAGGLGTQPMLVPAASGSIQVTNPHPEGAPRSELRCRSTGSRC